VIINLTTHGITGELESFGVVEPPPTVKDELIYASTFKSLPTKEEMESRIGEIVDAIKDLYPAEGQEVLIGGPAFFMSTLEKGLKAFGYKPVYGFYKRIQERVVEGGVRKKKSIFQLVGFVKP
jgi:hypothetical protein